MYNKYRQHDSNSATIINVFHCLFKPNTTKMELKTVNLNPKWIKNHNEFG